MLRRRVESLLNAYWYEQRYGFLSIVLSPLEYLYAWGFKRQRRKIARSQGAYRASIPVVIVGNISVGGTGKTPCVVALVTYLKGNGFRPGIVSRGYRSKAPQFPYLVQATDSAEIAGDEPLILAKKTGVPVVIDPNRPAAVKRIESLGCDVVISDDGLQHYALQRDVEIIVLDGQRGLGNGRCLPAGPLREPKERLMSANFIVANGESSGINPIIPTEKMSLIPVAWRNLADQCSYPIGAEHKPALGVVHAVAGIGNPKRFFSLLESMNYHVIPHVLADHETPDIDSLGLSPDDTIIMTEKDAVKLQRIPRQPCWCLEIEAQLSPGWFLRVKDAVDKVGLLGAKG